MIVFVEFFGLPGAGKSTLSQELTDRLQDRIGFEFASSASVLWDDRWKWIRRLNKARLVLQNSLDGKHGALVRSALRVKQSSQTNRLHAFFPLATYFSIRSQFKAKQQSAIFDQGLLQSAFSLIYSAVDDKEAKAAIAKLIDWTVESSQLHIIVETAPEICRSRLEQRIDNHSRLGSEDTENWDNSIRNFAHIKEQLYKAYSDRGLSPRVFQVNGTDPIEVSVERILDWVEANSTGPTG